jgi:hypothetical protein
VYVYSNNVVVWQLLSSHLLKWKWTVLYMDGDAGATDGGCVSGTIRCNMSAVKSATQAEWTSACMSAYGASIPAPTAMQMHTALCLLHVMYGLLP